MWINRMQERHWPIWKSSVHNRVTVLHRRMVVHWLQRQASQRPQRMLACVIRAHRWHEIALDHPPWKCHFYQHPQMIWCMPNPRPPSPNLAASPVMWWAIAHDQDAAVSSCRFVSSKQEKTKKNLQKQNQKHLLLRLHHSNGILFN